MTYPKFIRDRMLEVVEEVGNIEEMKAWKIEIDEISDISPIIAEIDLVLTAIQPPKKRGRPRKGEPNGK